MRDLRIDNDLFFIKKDFYEANSHTFKDVLTLSDDDFFNHFKYGNVNNISNHETWGIDFDYVIIAREAWYEGLSVDFRNKLKEETIKNGDAFLCGDILITKKRGEPWNLSLKRNFLKKMTMT